MKLSLIIPCYNEIKNLPKIIFRINQVFGSRNDVTIILVDNGSTDNSFFEMERLTKDMEFISLIRIKSNKGYGNGIKIGLDHVDQSDLIAWTHADLQTDIEDVLHALDIYKSQNGKICLVKGRRANRPVFDTIFSFGMQVFASILLRTRLDEINAQPKLMSREFYIEHIKENAPLDFSFDLYALYMAKKQNLEIISFPVMFFNRLHGEAKGGGGSSIFTKIKLIKRTFFYIVTLSKKVS